MRRGKYSMDNLDKERWRRSCDWAASSVVRNPQLSVDGCGFFGPL